MANAKKCDRCGKYYDKNEARTESGSVLTGVGFITANNHVLDHDLCDECIDKLKQFLKGVELLPF